MKGIVCGWIYPIIVFVVMVSLTTAGDMYIISGYDLDKDGFGEFILIDQGANPTVRYIELTKKMNHVNLWSKSLDDFPFILSHVEMISNSDSTTTFLVLSGPNLNVRSDNKLISLEGFQWKDSTFSDLGAPLISGKKKGDRLRLEHISYSSELNLVAISVNSPTREVLIYQPELYSTTFASVGIIDSLLMKNGLGKIMCEWFGTENNPLLAVFSLESDSISVDVFNNNSLDYPEFSEVFPIPELSLYPFSIKVRDLSGDGFNDILLPFTNDDIYSITIEDSSLKFFKTYLSQSGLFTLPPTANESEINTFLEAQINAGLIDSDFLMILESEFPDSVSLAFIDTISVGDTVLISAMPDSSSGFYSFRWTRHQPDSAYFDPHSGSIRWIPSDEDIGHHIFSYSFKIRVNESLIEDVDEFGDRHQIIPVLIPGDSTWGLVVVDSTQWYPPPVIHPPFKKKIFSMAVRTNEYDSTAYTFKGKASYQLETEVLPGRTGLHHSISTNIESLPREDEISFYLRSSSADTMPQLKLSVIHDLNSNVLSVTLNPALDSIPQTFYPGDWDRDLLGFPEYLFHGFEQDLIMDSLENSIVFHEGESAIQTDSLSQWIEVIGPSRPDHVVRILFNAGDLYEIRGTVRFRDDGSATTISEFRFSDEFYSTHIITNLIHSDDDFTRAIPLPSVKLKNKIPALNSEVINP